MTGQPHQQSERSNEAFTGGQSETSRTASSAIASSTKGLIANTTTTTSKLETFHKFPELLPELRTYIWRLTLPGPRLVQINYNPLSPNQTPRNNRASPVTSPTPPPVSLRICHESRSLALLHYSLVFNPRYCTGHIYFSPSTDILYIPPHPKLDSTPWELAPFQNLSLALTFIVPEYSWHIRKLAVHECVFTGAARIPNQLTLQKATFFRFWRVLSEKLQSLEEVSIFGDGSSEEEVLGDFWDDVGVEGVEGLTLSQEKVDALIVTENEVDRDADAEDAVPVLADLREETLYDIALRTYWDFRQTEPGWGPPRWRVCNGSLQQEETQRGEE